MNKSTLGGEHRAGTLNADPEVNGLERPEEHAQVGKSAPVTRADVYSRFALLIAGIAVVIAAATYFVSSALPAHYSASTTVRVAASPSSSASPYEDAEAANTLAAQYVHLVDVPSVVGPVERQMHKGDSFNVGASTVAGQNIIEISASSDSLSVARRASAFLANSFVRYVRSLAAAESKAKSQQYADVRKSLGLSVSAAQTGLSKALATQKGTSGSASVATRLQLLGQLQNSQATLQIEEASSPLATPEVQVLSSTGGSQTFPQPRWYALIAFLAALLIVAEIMVLVTRLRRSNQ